MKESKFVKTKIVAGYVILIAVCVLSVGYVYRAVVRFSTSDGSYSLLHTKRNVVGQTLYHLYQAESYGQLMIAGYKSYEARYKRELRTVRGYIDSLRNLAGEQDSLQTMRLDSIVRLLGDKERRTMNLRRTIRSAATASLLDKNIRELIGPADSVDSVGVLRDSVSVRTVVQDTLSVAVPRRKRNFFRRFADLFSPPKEDSSIVISHRERVVDSLPATAVKDTIAIVLRTLQDRVTSDRIGIYDRALDEGDTAALKAVAHKMTPIFTMLGAVQVAAALRTAESWEGPLTDTLCREVRTAAENIRAIIAEAQKKVSLS